jgi:DNA-binding NtrC family response regulator
VSTTLTLAESRAPSGDGLGPALFLVLEGERPTRGGARFELSGIELVSIGRGSERRAERRREGAERVLALSVPDPRMSSTHARLVQVLGRFVLEDAGSKNGTRVRGATVLRHTLQDGDVIELGRTFFLFRERSSRGPDRDASSLTSEPLGLRTLEPELATRFAALAQIARSKVPVIVRGESGTGKELCARAVHALSGRSGPFIAVNCGALPETLLTSELFGARRGAFSGATEDRPGVVRAAHKGTLFLDEIGDLPLAAQPAFLRVLQEGEVVSVGSTEATRVDVRVVCASHRDLGAMVDAETFRGDLFARLSGFTLELPPVRERRQDLGILVADLLSRNATGEVSLSAEAARALLLHPLPRNVRQLEQALGAALALARGGRVELDHLPEELRAPSSAPPQRATPDAAPLPSTPAPLQLSARESRQRDELLALLREHGGNISAVARVLGKARMQVQRWMKRYQLDASPFREGDDDARDDSSLGE